MEQNKSVTQRQAIVPSVVWFLGVGLVIAMVAIFFFNVAVSTVAYYGFFALMMGSHFFMHSSHGGHGSSAGHQHGPESNAVESDDQDTNQHSRHTGGCH